MARRTPPNLLDSPWPSGLTLDAVEVIDTLNSSRVIYWRADGSGLHELERALQQYGDQPDHYVVQGVTHDGRVLVDNQGGAGGEIRWMAKRRGSTSQLKNKLMR
jgi:hypothetical protein